MSADTTELFEPTSPNVNQTKSNGNRRSRTHSTADGIDSSPEWTDSDAPPTEDEDERPDSSPRRPWTRGFTRRSMPRGEAKKAKQMRKKAARESETDGANVSAAEEGNQTSTASKPEKTVTFAGEPMMSGHRTPGNIPHNVGNGDPVPQRVIRESLLVPEGAASTAQGSWRPDESDIPPTEPAATGNAAQRNREVSTSSESSDDDEYEWIIPTGPRTWGKPKREPSTQARGAASPVVSSSPVATAPVAPVVQRRKPGQTTINLLRALIDYSIEEMKATEKGSGEKKAKEVKPVERKASEAGSGDGTASANQTPGQSLVVSRLSSVSGSTQLKIGHSIEHWEKVRETMQTQGIFPTGPPNPPTWQKYVAPDKVVQTHPDDWWVLDPNVMALDPLYAEKMATILEKFPQVRSWRGILPPYPDPQKKRTLQDAEYLVPNLDELPNKLLLDYVAFSQQSDSRLNGPLTLRATYDNELILIYREIWNRRCARREDVLSALGMETTVGWAGGIVMIEKPEDVKKIYPGLAPETVKWCSILLKGFCRMPDVVGPKKEVWVHPRHLEIYEGRKKSAEGEHSSGSSDEEVRARRARMTRVSSFYAY